MTHTEDSNSPKETIVIGGGMQKGGVCKTTNALHLAAALAKAGRQVLLWDVDENYGATKVFGLVGTDHPATIDVLTGKSRVEDAIRTGADSDPAINLPPSLDFIPSSRALQGLERRGGAEAVEDPRNCLKPHVDRLKRLHKYDYVIIDTGPHASSTTRSSYLVSDYFILSLIPEMQAIASLPDALRDIANARKKDRNPNLHLLGLIMSNVDRRKLLHKYYEEAIDRGFVDGKGNKVKFATTISTAAVIDRAYQENQLLLQAQPAHRVSRQYQRLAREVEERIRKHRKERDLTQLASSRIVQGQEARACA